MTPGRSFGLFLAGCLVLCVANCSAKVIRKKVIVLGAGVSGIALAETLYQRNLKDFLVLEGRDYIGGRIRHVEFAGYLAPLGAGWIHNIGHNNPIWELARKYNLAVHYDDYNSVIVRNVHNGKVSNNWRNMFADFKDHVSMSESIIGTRKKRGFSDLPLASTIQMTGWKSDTPEKKAVEYFSLDFENGISPHVTSGRVYGITGHGKDVIVTDPRGYAHVLEKMAEPFRRQVLLNQHVTALQTSAKGTLIKTKDGKQYFADHVVITFSPGVLSSSKIHFFPALPKWKLEALELVPMCHYCKVFMRFPRTFWDRNRNYILLANKLRGHYVHWQNFEVPTLFHGRNVLLATVTEEHCLELQEKSNQVVIGELMEILRNIYGQGIPEPIEILRNAWSNDTFAMGSYPNPVVGMEDKDWEALRAPVGKQLWFAGDYNAGSEFYGFTHGAYMEGKAQGERLLECISEKICPSYNSMPRPQCVKSVK